MRHVLLLACGLGLAFAASGCKHIQYTAGVCDCDPPPVHTVVASPYAPVGAVVAAPATVIVKPPAVMPPVENGK
jgi:hypothetical protein